MTFRLVIMKYGESCLVQPLCQLLPTRLTPDSSPLVAACTYQHHKEIGYDQRIDVLRLLADETDRDFTTSDSQAWKMILVLLERSRPSSGFTSSDAAAVWILKLYQEELRRDWSPDNAFWLLLFCCESLAATEVLLRINPEVIHATSGGPLAFDVFQAKIAEGMPDTVLPSFRLLARSGADLHRIGTTHSYGAPGPPAKPQRDTATSLAVRRSRSFSLWRDMLHDVGLDPHDFAVAELQLLDSPLKLCGWQVTTLTTVLEITFEFAFIEVPQALCWMCKREVYRVYDLQEEWWDMVLSNRRAQLSRRQSTSSSDNSTNDEFFDIETVEVLDTEWLDDPPSFLCWKCDIMQTIRGLQDESEMREGGREERVP
jgi:hypothetical protein